LNLVCLLALALIFCYKRYGTSFRGAMVSVAVGFGMIFLVMKGIMAGLPKIAGSLEIVMVNFLGLPFGSGILL